MLLVALFCPSWAARGLVLALWRPRRCLAAPSRYYALGSVGTRRAGRWAAWEPRLGAKICGRRDHELSIPPIGTCGAMRAHGKQREKPVSRRKKLAKACAKGPGACLTGGQISPFGCRSS